MPVTRSKAKSQPTTNRGTPGRQLDVRIATMPAPSVPRPMVERMYRLVSRIRTLYTISGDRWDKRAKLTEMVDTPHLMYKIAFEQGTNRLVGFVSYVENDSSFDLEFPAITFIYELHASCTGRGLGRRMIDAVADEVHGPILLRTFEGNRIARRFYATVGFKRYEPLCSGKILFLLRVSDGNLSAAAGHPMHGSGGSGTVQATNNSAS